MNRYINHQQTEENKTSKQYKDQNREQTIKVKNDGSNSGHNGLESISSKIGNDYNRIRVGIDHPGNKDLVEKYVLTDFKKKEFETINKSFLIIKNNIELLINKKFDEFNSKVNNIL